MPPSRTSSLAILVHKRSPFSETSKSQKSEHDNESVLLRSHWPVPQTMHWSQTESSKWSLDCLLRDPGRPFITRRGFLMLLNSLHIAICDELQSSHPPSEGALPPLNSHGMQVLVRESVPEHTAGRPQRRRALARQECPCPPFLTSLAISGEQA